MTIAATFLSVTPAALTVDAPMETAVAPDATFSASVEAALRPAGALSSRPPLADWGRPPAALIAPGPATLQPLEGPATKPGQRDTLSPLQLAEHQDMPASPLITRPVIQQVTGPGKAICPALGEPSSPLLDQAAPSGTMPATARKITARVPPPLGVRLCGAVPAALAPAGSSAPAALPAPSPALSPALSPEAAIEPGEIAADHPQYLQMEPPPPTGLMQAAPLEPATMSLEAPRSTSSEMALPETAVEAEAVAIAPGPLSGEASLRTDLALPHAVGRTPGPAPTAAATGAPMQGAAPLQSAERIDRPIASGTSANAGPVQPQSQFQPQPQLQPAAPLRPVQPQLPAERVDVPADAAARPGRAGVAPTGRAPRDAASGFAPVSVPPPPRLHASFVAPAAVNSAPLPAADGALAPVAPATSDRALSATPIEPSGAMLRGAAPPPSAAADSVMPAVAAPAPASPPAPAPGAPPVATAAPIEPGKLAPPTPVVAPAPSPAEPEVAARPGQIGHAMGVAIAKRITAGGEELTVRLNPAEFGKIDVRMAFDEGGTLRAVVAAERPDALDLLRRDSADLNRAMTDAGIRTDQQSFRFDARAGGGGGDAQGFWQRQQQQRHQQAGDPRDTPPGPAAAREPAYQQLRSAGRVNLMA